MRLAVCALSAVLLSGCSWMGTGGSGSSSYGYGAGGGCMTPYGAQGGQYRHTQYGYGQQGGNCGAAGGYGVAGNGYGMGAAGAGGFGPGGAYGAGGYGAGNGYGMGAGGYGAGANGYGAGGYGAGANGYGVGTGALGLRGAQGVGANGLAGLGGGYGAGAYGAGAGMYGMGGAAGAGTVLGGAAPYGAAVGGATQYAGGGQWVNGQWVQGGSYGGAYGSTTTVQGAPIYVPQPYPAYYGVGGGGYGYRGASAAMPFGIEAGVGVAFGIGGDIVDAKPAGIATGGTLNVSATPAIAYKDAYDNAVGYDLATTYDVSPGTTLLARVGYSDAEGQRIKTGTVDDGVTTEDLYAQWSDMEQVTLEGGFRQYMGGWNNGMSGVRPYIGATAGFTHNSAVELAQDSATLLPAGSNVQSYTDAGWTPTASGVVGAEMQVGPRTAIGVEAGLRWSDDLNTIAPSEDRWSVPLKVRGRVSF